MPTKIWAVGEEVLAADFNDYVQEQVVSTFPTVAARDAALPSPPDGAVCVTLDTGTFWHWRTGSTSGAGWMPVTPGSTGALVRRSTSQSLASAVEAVIGPFDIIGWEGPSGSAWNPATPDRLVLPVPGVWLIWANARIDQSAAVDASSQVYVGLKVQGTTTIGIQSVPTIASSSSRSLTVSATYVTSTPGTFVQLIGYAKPAGTFTAASQYSSYFAAVLLFPL